jgi:hypothetical protein
MELSPRRTHIILFAFTLVLFAVQANYAPSNPDFGGDAGVRMIHSDSIGVRLGNRVWLPVLQSHIWALHHLGLPLWTYRLVPPIYFAIAVFALGWITIRSVGRPKTAVIAAGFVMLCFASQSRFVATRLYQEILVSACLYGLVALGALELKKDARLVLIGAVAMMVRDTFWIYLFALTVLNFKNISKDRSYLFSFGVLWSAIASWYAATFVGLTLVKGRLPLFPVEWPLMMNKHGNQAVTSVTSSYDSLLLALSRVHALWLIAAIFLIWLIAAVFFKESIIRFRNETPVLSKLFAFSLVSLSIAYALILLLDPWQATPGSKRMVYPILEHAYLWIAMTAGLVARFSRLPRLMAGGILGASAIFASGVFAGTWTQADPSETHASNERLERYLAELSPNSRISVCTVGEPYWTTVRMFSGPTRYEILRSLGEETQQVDPTECAVVLTPELADYDPGSSFRRVGEYSNYENRFRTYQNRSIQSGSE